MMKRLALGLALALLALPAAPVKADDFRGGLAAYNRGEYASAAKAWRPLAEQGHAKAQFNMAMLHFKGRGVPHDHVTGYMWFRLSLAHGYKRAAEGLEVVGRNMSRGEIARAEKMARDWLGKRKK